MVDMMPDDIPHTDDKAKRHLIVILVLSVVVASMAVWGLYVRRMQEQRKVISKLFGILDTPWTSCSIKSQKTGESVRISKPDTIDSVRTRLKETVDKEATRILDAKVFELVTYYLLEFKSSQTSLTLKFGYNPKEAYIEYRHPHRHRFYGTIFLEPDVTESLSLFLDCLVRENRDKTI